MSFQFSWPNFSNSFYADAIKTLDNALNKGKKPAIIADRINVRELNMGTLPPELEILEIGDLTRDRFRGIFRMTYSGDAYIELQTNVQANPLSHAKPGLDIFQTPSVLFASAPLIVPMRLRLSNLKLHAIIVLVVSRQKGITLVFKNDPLESVTVSSSFDSVGVIQGYIQREIENQLRELFRSDLPSIIHKMSQRWLSESAALSTQGFSATAKVKTETAFSHQTVVSDPIPQKQTSSTQSSPRKQRIHTTNRPQLNPRSPSELEHQSVPDSIQNYDPTYGMRSDSMNSFHSPTSLKQFGTIWEHALSSGMKDALELDEEEDLDREPDDTSLFSSPDTSFSISEQDMTSYSNLPAVGGGMISRPRVVHSQSQISLPRPSSSLYRESASVSEARSSITSLNDPTISPEAVRPSPGPLNNLRRHSMQYPTRSAPISPLSSRSLSTSHNRQLVSPSPLDRKRNSLNLELNKPSMTRSLSYVGPPRSQSQTSLPSETLSERQKSVPPSSTRTPSIYSSNSSPYFPSRLASSSFTSMPSSRSLSPVHELNKGRSYSAEDKQSRSPPPFIQTADMASVSFDTSGEMTGIQGSVEGITLDTQKNDFGAHIATLSRNFQTLSPFTRDLDFLHARSMPRHRFASSHSSASQAAARNAPRVKATRKRVHRIGKAKEDPRECFSAPNQSPPTCFTPLESLEMRRLSSVANSDYFPRVASERSISRLGLR